MVLLENRAKSRTVGLSEITLWRESKRCGRDQVHPTGPFSEIYLASCLIIMMSELYLCQIDVTFAVTSYEELIDIIDEQGANECSRDR